MPPWWSVLFAQYRSDEIARNMLTKLRTKDQVLEAKVSSGTADMMQILHANEQATIFIAEELGRVKQQHFRLEPDGGKAVGTKRRFRDE